MDRHRLNELVTMSSMRYLKKKFNFQNVTEDFVKKSSGI